MTEGTLIVSNKNLQVKFINKNGKEVSPNIKESELSASLLAKKKTAIAQLNGLEVELEEIGGQPKQIREKGQQWQASNLQTSTQKSNNQKFSQKQPFKNTWPSQTENRAIRQTTPSNIRGEFHNPYNFIPAPPRNTKHSELGDHLPKGHGCYHNDYWSGRISVNLTTITPLLIPDAANASEDNKNHKTYPIRVDAVGKPYLPPTSIKGMLRSAYEAVTNSRFGIFEKHEDRLAYRTPANANPNLFPARVEKQGDQLYLRIMDESSLVGGAAKLQRYYKRSSERDKGEQSAATKYEQTKMLPRHRDRVWVKLNAQGKVTNIRKWDDRNKSTIDWKEGWVCVTGANINGKMNERVFIQNEDNERILVTDAIKALWEELIRNYQETHEKDLEKRQKENESPQEYLGDKPGQTAWSRHIWDKNEIEFKEGTLCYVEIKNNEVIAIQPVTISRRLYKIPPKDLLKDTNLEPASCIDELSPAERVFGWVKQERQINQKGATSYKGNLRIFDVTCNSPDAIETFGEKGFPLAILGKPNEQQARFYQARDQQGNPLNSVNKEQAYFNEKQGLRGRKVYPHHNGLPDNHWNNPNISRTDANNGHYQEYRQPPGEDEKSDQNRSIQAWVKPQVKFSFTIDIINLSAVELGALLWLLSLEDNYYHRLGGGKPLGFGSVKLSINWDETDLRTGQDWRQYYSSLLPIPAPTSNQAKSCIEQFKKAVEETYGNGADFLKVSFIKAFSIAAQGFEDKLPIHYPRITKNSEGFDWFVENERVGEGLKLSLPFLAEDKGLPFNPVNSR